MWQPSSIPLGPFGQIGQGLSSFGQQFNQWMPMVQEMIRSRMEQRNQQINRKIAGAQYVLQYLVPHMSPQQRDAWYAGLDPEVQDALGIPKTGLPGTPSPAQRPPEEPPTPAPQQQAGPQSPFPFGRPEALAPGAAPPGLPAVGPTVPTADQAAPAPGPAPAGSLELRRPTPGAFQATTPYAGPPAPEPAAPTPQYPAYGFTGATRQGVPDDPQFQAWYKDILAKRQAMGKPLGTDPYDPKQNYDYYTLYKTGWKPPENWAQMGEDSGHFPSPFKGDENAHVIVKGVDTRTGQKVAPDTYTGPYRPGQMGDTTAAAPGTRPAGAPAPTAPAKAGYQPQYMFPPASLEEQSVAERFANQPDFVAEVERTMNIDASQVTVGELDQAKDPVWMALRARQARSVVSNNYGISTYGQYASKYGYKLVPGVKYDDPRLNTPIPLTADYEPDWDKIRSDLYASGLVEKPKTEAELVTQFNKQRDDIISHLNTLQSRIDAAMTGNFPIAPGLAREFNTALANAQGALGQQAKDLAAEGVAVDFGTFSAFSPYTDADIAKGSALAVAKEKRAADAANLAVLRYNLSVAAGQRQAAQLGIAYDRLGIELQKAADYVPPKVMEQIRQIQKTFNDSKPGSQEEADSRALLDRMYHQYGFGIPGPSGERPGQGPGKGADFQYLPIIKDPPNRATRRSEIDIYRNGTIPRLRVANSAAQGAYRSVLTQMDAIATRKDSKGHIVSGYMFVQGEGWVEDPTPAHGPPPSPETKAQMTTLANGALIKKADADKAAAALDEATSHLSDLEKADKADTGGGPARPAAPAPPARPGQAFMRGAIPIPASYKPIISNPKVNVPYRYKPTGRYIYWDGTGWKLIAPGWNP